MSYYYHVIPGDTSSQRIDLSKDELYHLEKTLSTKACENYKSLDDSYKAQREIATLISISYHCLGGNDPCHLSINRRKGGGYKNTLLPNEFRSDYISFFIEELIKMMTNFDRSKGCWTQYVRWARGKGLRRVFPMVKASEACTKMDKEELAMTILGLEEAINSRGTYCLVDSYLEQTKELDSIEAINERYKREHESVDGLVVN